MNKLLVLLLALPLVTQAQIRVQDKKTVSYSGIARDGSIGTNQLNAQTYGLIKNPNCITYTLSVDTGYGTGTNIDITHPTGWVYADIEAIGGGGAGASGSCRTNGVVSHGGSSGSSGSITRRRIFASEVTNTFFRCVVPAGGTGGASVSADADGNAGTDGAAATIKDGATSLFLVYAFKGYGGSATAGGIAVGSEFVGAAGTASSASGTYGLQGVHGAIGSGGAGGGITTGNAWSAGGPSGRTTSAPVDGNYLAETTLGGATEGADGANGVSTTTSGPGRAGGGGASSTAGDGGDAGNGGKYGASGGGGGASRLGVGASGKGGDGAPGIIKIAYFVNPTN